VSGLPPEQEARIRQIAQSGRMIEAIKEYRLLTNAGLAESKAAVEALRFGTGVSVAAPQPSAVESSRAKQILDLMAQEKKIEAIKLYRGWTGADLKQAKDAVEALARGESVQIPLLPASPAGGASVDDQIRAMLAKKQKIEAIKIYRLATRVGLKEAKDYVEALEAQTRGSSFLSQYPDTPSAISDDPITEENIRMRRTLALILLVLVVLAGLAFLFLRNGL
jgi:ribosomal protein L7/L12